MYVLTWQADFLDFYTFKTNDIHKDILPQDSIDFSTYNQEDGT